MAAQLAQNWDQWNGYYYLFGEGERCVVTFNVPACDPQNQRPSCGRRVIGFSPDEYVSPEGMPSGPAFERLRALEARMTELLAYQRVPCWLVGKQMYRGMRELLFQIEEPYVRGFEEVYAHLATEFAGTKLVAYDGWKFFNDKIVPNGDARGHIANRDLIEVAKRHGADLSALHTLDHTFVGEASALARVRHALIADGYREAGSSNQHVTLSSTAILEQDGIDAITQQLRDVAEGCRVRYDGWGLALRA